MDTLLGIVVIAVIVSGIFLYQKGVNALGRQANQKVFARKGHREGEELVSQRLVFTSSASVDEVREAILSTVKVAPNVPAIIAEAHLIEAADTYILYGYGNKMKPHNFRGLLELEVKEGGVQGAWNIVNWTLADGIVEGQSVMKRLVADINTALRSLDENATLRPAGAGGRT
jgi:hypothetical protein